MENLEEFKKMFGGKFWKTISIKSFFPLENLDKDSLLSALHTSIDSGRYRPSPPRKYIVINKGGSVARLIPIFEPQDTAIFFYCSRKLESEIAVNRVPNTYGGWSLGGSIREHENQEINDLKDSFRVYEAPDGATIVMDESSEYAIPSSFDPDAWRAQWKDFSDKLYAHSRTEDHSIIVEMDIANFYDSIDLRLLKAKIKQVAPTKSDIIDLLFKFLIGVNSIGIPQDESADCSRILANFYLQEYDHAMLDLCNEYGAKYFRYADDQLIFSDNQEKVDDIICKASLLLTRLGLSINQKKVKVMNRDDFESYYAFDWFIRLGSKPTRETLDLALQYYLENKKSLRIGRQGSPIRVLMTSIVDELSSVACGIKIIRIQ